MANLYFSCLLLLAVAASINCSTFEGQVKTCEKKEDCVPLPYCSEDKKGTTFKSGDKKALYWKCTSFGQPLACMCPSGQVFCPCNNSCQPPEEARKCYEKMQALGKF